MKYTITDYSSSNNILSSISTESYDNYKTYDSITLYDTNFDDKKIICAKRYNQNLIGCLFFQIKNKNTYYLETAKLVEHTFNFDSAYFSENNCYFSEFNSEYIFCCALSDYIKCFKLDKDYNINKEFKLDLSGKTSYFSTKSYEYYMIFYYMSTQGSLNQIYYYYIFIPECETKDFDIYNTLNENKSERDIIRIKNFFKVKSNKYYVKFQYDNDIGYFLINDLKIDSNIEKTLVENDEHILDFIITNTDFIIAGKFTVKYYVIVENDDAYNVSCNINFNHKLCYESCKTCSADKSNSNIIEHNCLECQDNYYHSPIKYSNCFKKEEKERNWYFDETISEFGVCDDKCKTCSGPANNNCLSCENGLYLYIGQCRTEVCPEGYFSEIIEEEGDYYKKCFPCYENCKSCIKGAEHDNMNCQTCKVNHIKYNDNCYTIHNNNIKNFFIPEMNEIKSCKDYSLYIKEDGWECIPEIEEGYFLSNEETGLISKCFEKCLSCENGEKTDEESEKIISMECTECKEPNKMIKVNNNCFDIKEYDFQKIFFDTSLMKSGKEFDTCLTFDLCIYFGEHECIPKSDYTFYVLNGVENTGIIKNCNSLCKTCKGEGNVDNTNCIECIDG